MATGTIWFACDPGSGGGPKVPTVPASEQANSGAETPGPAPLEDAGAAAQLPAGVAEAQLALRIVAQAVLFHGEEWRDHLPTEASALRSVNSRHEQVMSQSDAQLYKAALEIIANPSELAAWRQRLDPVVFTPREIERLRASKARLDAWRADFKRRVEENRQRIREEGGAPQGSDSCGGGLPGAQDDADCNVCDAECWEEADHRVEPLHQWQDDVCGGLEGDAYDDCIAETDGVISDSFQDYYEECCNSTCPTCPAGWCGP